MPKQTVLEKVVVALRALKDHKGSSRVALQKYLKSELDCENAVALKAALKKGVKDGVLTQVCINLCVYVVRVRGVRNARARV